MSGSLSRRRETPEQTRNNIPYRRMGSLRNLRVVTREHILHSRAGGKPLQSGACNYPPHLWIPASAGMTEVLRGNDMPCRDGVLLRTTSVLSLGIVFVIPAQVEIQFSQGCATVRRTSGFRLPPE